MAKKIHQLTTLFAGVVLCSSLGMAQAAATAQDSSKAAEPKATNKDSKDAGMVVFVDPITHKIRPAEKGEVNALTNSKAAAAKSLAKSKSGTSAKIPATSRLIAGPSGSKGVVMGQNMLQYMVVSKTAGGALKEECVTGDKNAQQALTGAPDAKPLAPAQGELDVQ